MANDYDSQTFAETHWRTATECRFDGINIGSSRVGRSARASVGHARLCENFAVALISWSLRLGTSLEDRPRYTPTTTFETFPFPAGLTPNIPARECANDPRAIAIAKAAKRLDELRNAWLNPPDLIDIVPEVVSGYPNRILPKHDAAAAELKQRTLTNLYNQHPQWLSDAHRDLDVVVAAAYGWPADISEDGALSKLLELNQARAGTSFVEAPAEDSNDADGTNGVRRRSNVT